MRTTKYGNSSFCYVAAGVWNSVLNDLRKIEDFKEFRRLVVAERLSCKCAKKLIAFTYVLLQFPLYLLCLALLNFYLVLFSGCFAFAKFLFSLELFCLDLPG